MYLQRERDINQALPGTAQANPGVNIAALRPYKGYATIRLAENAASRCTTACRSAPSGDTGTASSSASRIRSGTRRTTRSGKRDVLFNNYDDTGFWGNSSFDRRHVLGFLHLRFALLPRTAGGHRQDRGRVADYRFDLHAVGNAACGRDRGGNDIAGTGDTFGNPWNVNGDPKASANEQFSAGTSDQNSGRQDGVLTRRRLARSATGPATSSTTRVRCSGISRYSRTSRCQEPAGCSCGRKLSTS